MQCACWSVCRLCRRFQLVFWPYSLLIHTWALGPSCFLLKMSCFFPNDNHAFFWCLRFPGLGSEMKLVEHKKQPIWPKPRKNQSTIHSLYPDIGKRDEQSHQKWDCSMSCKSWVSQHAFWYHVSCDNLYLPWTPLSELHIWKNRSSKRAPQVE